MTIKRKIFSTGADGFIGSHLAERLVRDGCQVKALAQYNSLITDIKYYITDQNITLGAARNWAMKLVKVIPEGVNFCLEISLYLPSLV